MAFWMAIFVSLAMTVAGELLRPKQKVQNAQASGLDEFDIPTAEEGRSIPIFCGKVKVTGPNVTAYGDLESRPLSKKVKTGLFSSRRQTYAHRYLLGMQFAISHGRSDVDVHEIHFGDAMPQHTRTAEADGVVRFDFTDENFFGGDEKEGGISGTLRLYPGNDVQPASAYLASLIGETEAPAYRGLCHAVAEKMYFGTSQYIKPVSFIVSSYPNTLNVTNGRQRIGDDANPACFLFELLTNQVWGVGLQASDIDQAQFRAIANTLHAEGYGVSLIYNGQSSAEDVVDDVLRHVDGVMFSDPETGLITIRLARADYAVADLPELTEMDFSEAGVEFSRSSWSDTKNTVKGTYVDRAADYTTAVVSQQDLANVMQRGGEVVAEDIDFSGFSTYAPAAMAVARALKTLSYPLARLTGELDRRFWKMRPGDVFLMQHEELGIEAVVFRVIRVRYGGLQSNTIGIEAAEDIFSVSNVAYVQPPPTGWVNPLVPPAPMLIQSAAEMPYGLEPADGSIIGTFGMRSSGMDEGYSIVSDRTPPYTQFDVRDQTQDFTPFGVIAAAYPAGTAAVETVGPTVGALRGSPDSTDTWEFARIVSGAGEEWVAYRTFVGGVMGQVVRGVFDTPPLSHPAGALVYFATSGYGRENDGSPYTASQTVHVRLLPYNPRGELPRADAANLVVATTRRGSRPYPPGRVRVDGVHPLSAPAKSGTFAVSWANRNRLYPALLTQDDESVAPESGNETIVRAFRADNNALLATGIGNMTSASIRLAYTGTIRVETRARVNGLESRNAQSFTLAYTSTQAGNVVTVDSAQYILDGGGAA